VILVDTSIWIDHLRGDEEGLIQLLNDGKVLVHPFVTGELALGNLNNREAVMGALQNLPQAFVATDGEVLRLIQAKSLFGRGIGYIDAHLVAAVLLMPGTTLWTRDKRLLAASAQLGMSFDTSH